MLRYAKMCPAKIFSAPMFSTVVHFTTHIGKSSINFPSLAIFGKLGPQPFLRAACNIMKKVRGRFFSCTDKLTSHLMPKLPMHIFPDYKGYLLDWLLSFRILILKHLFLLKEDLSYLNNPDYVQFFSSYS